MAKNPTRDKMGDFSALPAGSGQPPTRSGRQTLKDRHAGNQTAQAGLYMGDVSRLRFDYDQIPINDRMAVQAAALEIKQRQRNIAVDLIAIGRYFLTAKAILDHGLFVRWIEVEFGYRYRAAAEEMNIARRFDGKPSIIEVLTPTVMRLLAAPTVPDAAIARTVSLAVDQGKAPTVQQTKAIVEEYKAPTKALAVAAPTRAVYLDDGTVLTPIPTIEPPAGLDAGSATIEGDYTIATNALPPTPPVMGLPTAAIALDDDTVESTRTLAEAGERIAGIGVMGSMIATAGYTIEGLEAEQAAQARALLVPGYIRMAAGYAGGHAGVVLRLGIIRKVRAAALRGILRDYLTGEETDALVIALTNALEREGQGGQINYAE